MKIDLREAFSYQPYSKEFDFDIDLSEIDYFNNISGKAQVKVFISNHANIVTSDMKIDCEYEAVCDRCLDEFKSNLKISSLKDVVTSVQDDDLDVILVDKDIIFDAKEEAITQIIFSFPQKYLCKEDCKGLCPKCGCNLNLSKCDCDDKEIDPRLEVLKNLF